MKVEALEFYVNGFMKEAFAMGGTMEPKDINEEKTYPSSLQNYLIDTGDKVILVDTGVPVETPDFPKSPNQKIYTGEKKADFLKALEAIGYTIEDIDIVLLTHKHPDHAGELRRFKNAKIYVSKIEADEMKLEGENIVRIDFTDGPYREFEASQKIVDGVYMIPAYGHTKGNSLVIAEEKEFVYMLHGDITYTDEALLKKHLSIVFEDKEAARKTLENVYTFVKNNKTVYLSTHTPEGVVSLKEKKIFEITSSY